MQTSHAHPREMAHNAAPRVPRKAPLPPRVPPRPLRTSAMGKEGEEGRAPHRFNALSARSPAPQHVDLAKSAMEDDEKLPSSVYFPTASASATASGASSRRSSLAGGGEEGGGGSGVGKMAPWETPESTAYAPRPRDVMRTSTEITIGRHEKAGLDRPFRPHFTKVGAVLSSDGVRSSLEAAPERTTPSHSSALSAVPSIAEIGSPDAGRIGKRMMRKPAVVAESDEFRRAMTDPAKTFSHLPLGDGSSGGSGGATALISPTGAKATRRRKRASAGGSPSATRSSLTGGGIVPTGEVVDARRQARVERGGIGHDERKHVAPSRQPHQIPIEAFAHHASQRPHEATDSAFTFGHETTPSHLSLVEAIATGGLGSPAGPEKRHAIGGRGAEDHLQGPANVESGYDPFFVPSTDLASSHHRRRLRRASTDQAATAPASAVRVPPFGVDTAVAPSPPPQQRRRLRKGLGGHQDEGLPPRTGSAAAPFGVDIAAAPSPSPFVPSRRVYGHGHGKGDSGAALKGRSAGGGGVAAALGGGGEADNDIASRSRRTRALPPPPPPPPPAPFAGTTVNEGGITGGGGGRRMVGRPNQSSIVFG